MMHQAQMIQNVVRLPRSYGLGLSTLIFMPVVANRAESKNSKQDSGVLGKPQSLLK